MKKFAYTLLAGAGALTLAACGGADDASIEAEADTVEMPADAALEGVEEQAVEDTGAADEPAAVTEDTATEAADAAADVAAAAEAAAAELGVEE
jgi:hypothetical protein